MKQKKAKRKGKSFKNLKIKTRKPGLYRIKCNLDEVMYLSEYDFETYSDEDILHMLLSEIIQSINGGVKFSLNKIKSKKDVPKDWHLSLHPYNSPSSDKNTGGLLYEEYENGE